jgi:hypothetical protein
MRRWNGGVLRGAQFRLAKALKIDQTNIRRWVEGGYGPKEELRPRVAKLLKISVDELMSSLRASAAGAKKGADDPLSDILSPEEAALLAKAAEKDLRSPEQEIRWLVRAYAAGKLVEPGRDFTLK